MSDSSANNTIDSSNLLYLHPSDHLGLILVSKQFDGPSYGSWKRMMSIALSAKSKTGFVDGTITSTTDTSALWKRCNDMVLSWILNTLSKEISKSVLYVENASQLWKELAYQFGISNGAQLYQLQHNLCNTSQGSSSITAYFTKLKSLWDELASLSTPSLLPSISKAYSLLTQDEKQKEIHPANHMFHESSSSMHVNTKISNNSKKPFCTHCMKVGHLASRDKFQPRAIPCLFLGYPKGKKGYKLLNLHTHQTFVSRDVVLFEHLFPSIPNHSSSVLFPSISVSPAFFDHVSNLAFPSTSIPSSSSPSSNSFPVSDSISMPDLPSMHSSEHVRRSTRQTSTPAYLKDYYCSSAESCPHTLFLLPRLIMYIPLLFQFPLVLCMLIFLKFKNLILIRLLLNLLSGRLLGSWSLMLYIIQIHGQLLLCLMLDVNNVFLHEDHDEDIYMSPPPGMILEDSNQVLKLQKSLYGLKQASRQWYAKLSDALKSRGYLRSLNDHSLFSKSMGSSVVHLVVYVDDILLTSNNFEEISALKAFLNDNFKIKDLGHLNYCLGIEVVSVPNVPNSVYAVSTCSSLGGCIADSCFCQRRSIIGFVVLFGGNPISWKSKKQPTVSLSSTEAEYRSMRKVTTELTWLTRVLNEFSIPSMSFVNLICDSKAAIHIARNPVYHERTKHIDLDCQFVREKRQAGLIQLTHVSTNDQPGDLFTKSLNPPKFQDFVSKLGLSHPPT
ncbi:hypothetical protein SSX86_001357 [Deinandra increscens subsp. villosa]|uniref:Uncharacterized protein n=1 Tax=Deinandra increscens subsp. villosa TaxID=3103831 RepID=A0AAP0DRG9_9ASTR